MLNVPWVQPQMQKPPSVENGQDRLPSPSSSSNEQFNEWSHYTPKHVCSRAFAAKIWNLVTFDWKVQIKVVDRSISLDWTLLSRSGAFDKRRYQRAWPLRLKQLPTNSGNSTKITTISLRGLECRCVMNGSRSGFVLTCCLRNPKGFSGGSQSTFLNDTA